MGAWSDKRRVYYPSPQTLAESFAENPESAPRYFVFPDFSSDSPLWNASTPDTPPLEAWLEVLRDAGFTVSSAPVFEVGGFTVYEVVY
jgi:hypothetical protein